MYARLGSAMSDLFENEPLRRETCQGRGAPSHGPSAEVLADDLEQTRARHPRDVGPWASPRTMPDRGDDL